MQSFTRALLASSTFLVATSAWPLDAVLDGSFDSGLQKRYDGFPDDLNERLGTYQPPGPNDSRGPCPGLNTLANHGLINRDGKNILSDDVNDAFARGFGINSNGIATALHNWAVICEYVKGQTCGFPENNGSFLLTNLTILGLPHSFEHDHSFSRLDYKEGFGNGGITDNIYFNASEMQTGLDVVNYVPSNPAVKATADFQDFNQIRLQRESLKNTNDFPGWFLQVIPTTLFEAGFIFGTTFDRDSNGKMIGDEPVVRLDWWNFWFSEESFPTQLGWYPAQTTDFEINFITSVSKQILAASITSVAPNLPAGATASTATPPNNLPEADPSPLVPLFPGTAYIAPTQPAAIEAAQKREAQAASTTEVVGSTPTEAFPSSAVSVVTSATRAHPKIIASATSLAGPAPLAYNPYVQSLDQSMLAGQIALAASYESKVVAKVTSLASAQ